MLQVGFAQIGAKQVGPAQAGAVQVAAPELGADQVGSGTIACAVVHLVTDHRADTVEQRADLPPVSSAVDAAQLLGRLPQDVLGMSLRLLHLVVQSAGRQQGRGLSQIPEQFLELPHDREHGEHRLGGLGGLPPVAAAKRHLHDMLARSEAVEDGTAWEALLAQVRVDSAAGVGAQLGAGAAGRLVDGEVRGRREGRRDAAKADAASAVGSQVGASIRHSAPPGS